MSLLSLIFLQVCIIFLCPANGSKVKVSGNIISGNIISANITDYITSQGYPLEIHTALTADGYELILHRIPHGRYENNNTRGAVLLQHGLTDSSAGWCLNGPGESLAFILADEGYDVWLGNNRGNGYSMRNINYGPDDSRFWAFSWDEMAQFDFPTNINYILARTGQSKISYIGHSEGTIQAFAGLITQPALADKLHVYIGLAPVAYVNHISLELLTALAKLKLEYVVELLGFHEFYLIDAIHKLLPFACEYFPQDCVFGGSFFYGTDSFLNASRLDFYTDYEPFPTSVQNIVHWAQGVTTDSYQKFDFGETGNMAHYGQATPPLYKLSDFPSKLPVVLFTGGVDQLADVTDVYRLIAELPSGFQIFYQEDYGHLDPLLGSQAHKITYPELISVLEKYHN